MTSTQHAGDVQCTVYNVQCTLYSVYNIHCTLYIVQCILYSVYCTHDGYEGTVYIVHVAQYLNPATLGHVWLGGVECEPHVNRRGSCTFTLFLSCKYEIYA